MKNKINNINREFLKKKKFIKNEIKIIVFKSIIQNLNVKPYIRSSLLKKISKIKNSYFLSKQKNNICLKSGRFKGVLKLTNLTRHEIKKMGTIGSLQNIKIKSW